MVYRKKTNKRSGRVIQDPVLSYQNQNECEVTMGLRSTVIRIKNMNDLMAAMLMEQGLEDTAEYGCFPIIYGAIQWRGKIWLLFSQDCSSAADYYHFFSPTFNEFFWLDDLEVEDSRHGYKIVGAKYLTSDELLRSL